MKKKFSLIIVFLIVVIGLTAIILVRHNFNEIPSSVAILQYNDIIDVEKTDITSEKDISELSKYVKKIKTLKKHEMVKLALLQDIEIEYTDSIRISIQLGEKEYCYYEDKEKNISSLARMPKGLHEWVEEKID